MNEHPRVHPKVNDRPCPDDLLVAARRRWLSDLERKALSAHLARCESCRAGERAATILREPFAGAGTASEADRALVERVAARASAALAQGAHRGGFGWRRVAVGVIVFLGLGGVASAWIGRSWISPRVADRGAAVAAGSLVRPRVFRRNNVASAPETPPPVAPPARPAQPQRHIVARPIRDPAVAVATRPAESAASLFAAANGARRDGELRRAVALYEALRAAFPDSAEARVSAISRGDLLLRLDEPARALRAFDAYLSEGGGGSLREEALFGRARCARKLGDDAGERSSWSRLVQEFPSSAYGPVARQRLGELRRSPSQ